MINTSWFRLLRLFSAGFLLLGLFACASGDSHKPLPADLGANPALIGIKGVWNSQIGPVDFPLQLKAVKTQVALASSDGNVLVLDANSGAAVWRANVGPGIAAGVGFDGRFAALVTHRNELIVLELGKELWRARLTGQVFTAPLVAGDRVFVLAADRTISAFDALTGRKLWQNQRPGEALVLRQAGVLLAVNNTLVAGVSGRLVGLNPALGSPLWDVAIATPRGTNDIERLVDLLAGVRRSADVVCARAFQSAVACVDAGKGKLLWRQNAIGSVGVQGDGQSLFGVESDGRVLAWRAGNGEQIWESDRLRFRQLSAPLALGRSVVMGDNTGLVHLMSREDGTLLNRLTTDGSAVDVTPVLVDNTLVVVTRKGGIFGFRPE